METRLWKKDGNVPADPSGNPTTFTLVVGTQTVSVVPDDSTSSIQSVVRAINTHYGNRVQATMVNVGPNQTCISLKSATLGATNLDLLQVPTTATPRSLQTQAPDGYSISQTTAKWDASGDPSDYILTIGGVSYTIPATTSNSAVDVAAAINASTYGSQVRAWVVDVGTSGSPDPRIFLQSTATGSIALNLNRVGGAALQTPQTAATSLSSAAWVPDAAGRRSTYNLVIGSSKYSFTPADSSATTVAATVNSLYGSQVQATVVDFGTPAAHDYRISLQNKTGSTTTLDIERTTGISFQDQKTTGALASYEMNNSGVTNTSTTRNITVSTAVTATLLGLSGGTPTDITITRSSNALSTALKGLAEAYNAAVDELATQRGQTAGPLSRQSIVNQLSSLLGGSSTYSSSRVVPGLKGLGLDLGYDGHLTFTPSHLLVAHYP